jgi:phosphatidylinositol alpha 1,6-mannosyltransferase
MRRSPTRRLGLAVRSDAVPSVEDMSGSAVSTLVGRDARSATPGRLRVLVVTESFLPQVNGVTNSVLRVLDHLADTGHTAAVVAPSGPDVYAGARVHRVASVAMPTYRDFPLGLASRHTLRRIVGRFRPDVVHLASPALLGRAAGAVARGLGVPVVAVYQTDLIGFADRYPFPGAAALMRRLTTSIHRSADLNLVPSTASLEQFDALRIARAVVWPRGVDGAQFNPRRRTDELRRGIGARRADVIVGYVGRLAAEKELELLAAVRHLPDHRLVIVGGGPEEARLRALLPDAHFLGVRHGADLGRIVASLDVFVHTGRNETFCQAAQEALVSGVPVVAPDAGGLRDLVTPGVNGLLYTPGDRGDLYASIEALARDGWLRTRMGAAAATGCRERSWRSVNEALVDHYRSLAGTARTRDAC